MTDIERRYTSHVLTPNEARALEDLPPLPGGDELRPLTNQPPQSSPQPDDKTDQEQTDD